MLTLDNSKCVAMIAGGTALPLATLVRVFPAATLVRVFPAATFYFYNYTLNGGNI